MRWKKKAEMTDLAYATHNGVLDLGTLNGSGAARAALFNPCGHMWPRRRCITMHRLDDSTNHNLSFYISQSPQGFLTNRHHTTRKAEDATTTSRGLFRAQGLDRLISPDEAGVSCVHFSVSQSLQGALFTANLADLGGARG